MHTNDQFERANMLRVRKRGSVAEKRSFEPTMEVWGCDGPVTMTGPCGDHHAARMRALYGFTPWPGVNGTYPCPRWLIGKQCQAWRSHSLCVCQKHGDVLDHVYGWKTGDASKVITAEPYGLGGDDFTDFCVEMRDLGIGVHVRPVSPWYPGWTRMIQLTAKAVRP